MRKIAEYTKAIPGGATVTATIVPASLPGIYVVRVTHVPSVGGVELDEASLLNTDASAAPGTFAGSSGSGAARFAFEANGLAPTELSITTTGDSEALGYFLVEVLAA